VLESHAECDAIIDGGARVDASPKLSANHPDAALIHEAAIGKIAGEQILKLRTLGLTEQEAEEKIIQGLVLSRVMRKYNSVTYEVGKAKAEQAAGMFGLAAGQRAASCPSRVAKPLAKPLTGGWRSASYARSQQSAPCFSRSICSSDFMLM